MEQDNKCQENPRERQLQKVDLPKICECKMASHKDLKMTFKKVKTTKRRSSQKSGVMYPALISPLRYKFRRSTSNKSDTVLTLFEKAQQLKEKIHKISDEQEKQEKALNHYKSFIEQ